MKLWSALFLSVFFAFSLQAEQRIIVRLDLKKYGLSTRMISPDMDIAGQNIERGTIDLVVNSEEYENLMSNGYEVEVISKRIQAAPDQRYLNYSEIIQMIQELVDQHPEIVDVKEIGRSLQGRKIYAVRLSTKDNLKGKPAVLFNGMHHAREIMTTEVTTDIMRYLANNFDNPDMPRVRQWLENLQIWIVPQVNPDGNEIVWTSDNMWRKNARGDGSDVWGVDINRNYPFQWNACNGSSGSPGSQTYRGTAGGSEPETKALMDLVKGENILLDVSYHSYSELVIAPYGCQGQYTPENLIFQNIGKNFASRLTKDGGQGTYRYGTGWEILYPVDGDDIGWMYNEVNTLAYVVEMNSDSQGFQPNYDKWRNITVERQRRGWQYMLDRAMAGPQVRGHVTRADNGQSIEAEVRIKDVAYRNNEKPRRTRNGVFHKLMVPGSYELLVSAPGFETEIVPVNVDNGVLDIDVALRPQAEMDDLWGF